VAFSSCIRKEYGPFHVVIYALRPFMQTPLQSCTHLSVAVACSFVMSRRDKSPEVAPALTSPRTLSGCRGTETLNFYTCLDKDVCLWSHIEYSEISIYRSRMYRFAGAIVQFLWFLNKSYLISGPRIVFQYPSFFFSGPPTKKMNRGFTVLHTLFIQEI
jgi:hypothetical protein